MTEPLLMVGLGEVLWDLLPSGRVLGGAPTNFAYMTSVLGNRGIVASRVGRDVLGEQACEVMNRLGLTTTYIQRDEEHETGTAAVLLDSAGLPTFTIKQFVAWDFLDWTSAWEELSGLVDVVCYGSLAQRSLISAHTIDRFLGNTRKETLKIFDVNLRQSFYTSDVLLKLFQHANIAKLTDHEMRRVGSLFLADNINDIEQLAKWLRTEFRLEMVCITRGDRGSLLVSEEGVVEHRGLPAEVVDTVGAGDAFTACLAHQFVRGHSLSDISQFANRFASWVVTQRGATPKIDPKQLQEILAGAEGLKYREGVS
jgi:fructokinase